MSEEEFGQFVEQAKAHKMTLEDVHYLINRDKANANVANSTKQDMLNQMKSVRDIPASAGDSNSQPAVNTPDEEIINAYKILAKEGVFCEPASAASVAGLIKNKNRIQKESTIVCVLTGNGLKDPDCAIKNNDAIFRKNIEPSLKNITKILGY